MTPQDFQRLLGSRVRAEIEIVELPVIRSQREVADGAPHEEELFPLFTKCLEQPLHGAAYSAPLTASHGFFTPLPLVDVLNFAVLIANDETLHVVPSSELSTFIRELIAALPTAEFGQGLNRDCKAIGALPIHGTLIYLWLLRPDGEVLCMDHEAFMRPTEVETDPVKIYAAMRQGAKRYPELEALVPAPPAGIRECTTCGGMGSESRDGETLLCFSCNGMGWLIRGEAAR